MTINVTIDVRTKRGHYKIYVYTDCIWRADKYYAQTWCVFLEERFIAWTRFGCVTHTHTHCRGSYVHGSYTTIENVDSNCNKYRLQCVHHGRAAYVCAFLIVPPLATHTIMSAQKCIFGMFVSFSRERALSPLDILCQEMFCFILFELHLVVCVVVIDN